MERILQRFTELDEVKNAILLSKDGLLVAGVMRSEDEEMIGALSAAAFGSINNYTTQMKTGNARQVMIETNAGGMVYMQETDELILMVITQRTSNPGRVRLEMRKACRQLMQMINR